MSSTTFYKMTGSGNDFVMLDGRATGIEEWPLQRIVAVCDRRNGVGADGLVILTPEAPGTVRMTYFNADGTPAAMCGNAALCSTRLAARLGMAPAVGMELRTGAGPVRSRCIEGSDDAEINLPGFARPAAMPAIELARGERSIHFATVGVPHLVVRVPDASAVDVVARGRALRSHSTLSPAGANVNFVSPPTPETGDRWRIRTYERGVENETYACGTGTVAAAVVLAQLGEAQPPSRFVSWGGAPLGVRATLDGGRVREIWLQGQGRLVFEGCLTD